jgi:transcriptional regulator with XRE-family HTH domain
LLVEKRGGRGIREVAREIGISPATLSRVENGRLPNIQALMKICDWLDVEMGEFLGVRPGGGKSGASGDLVSVHLKAESTPPQEIANVLADMIMKAQEMMKEAGT